MSLISLPVTVDAILLALFRLLSGGRRRDHYPDWSSGAAEGLWCTTSLKGTTDAKFTYF